MPNLEFDRSVYTLQEVANSISRIILFRYSSAFWVQAEMNKLNFYQRSGHCYPELVEKREGKIIAQMKATLWKEDYARIDARFRALLNEPLKEGIKILFQAKVTHDAVHGLSLWIMDIDPAYTLGDLEREKLNAIQRLRTEGLFNQNKLLPLPLLPQRVAIISIDTSKGYADFINVIQHNPYGYDFFHMIFPSLLQGDKAAEQIMTQLKRIIKVRHHFDAVAIIRGGGGDVGLSCYNHYGLAKAICQFPLPVLTGIGHSTNETVAEMVSHTNAITPTKLAEWLIQRMRQFAVPVEEAGNKIAHATEMLLAQSKHEIQHLAKSLRAAVRAHLQQEAYAVNTCRNKLGSSTRTYFAQRLHGLQLQESTLNHLDPSKVLARGYSITLHNGKLLTSIKSVHPEDTIATQLADGTIISTIQSIEKNHE